MKKLLFILAVLLTGCSPRVVSGLRSGYSPIPETVDVTVLPQGTTVPEGAEVLGSVKVGDTGFTSSANGRYENVLAIIKEQARSAGGNLVLITRHQVPDLVSSIHRMEALVLRTDQPLVLASEPEKTSHPDYAVIYLYRLAGAGALVSYDVYLDDTKVFRSRTGHKCEVKVYAEGAKNLYGATESKTVFPLDIKLGEEYYIRCGVSVGILIGRPVFERALPGEGKAEYEAIQEND